MSWTSTGGDLSLITTKNLVTFIAIWIAYLVLKSLYNISPLHPLYKIPGPKLAAATYLPEFYYDLILHDRYPSRIQALHDKYGPIVRLSPHELHCNDINFVDEIYPIGTRKRDKPQQQVNYSVLSLSHHATAEHDLHRKRRMPVIKFLSRSNVLRRQSEIQALAFQLSAKLLSHADKEESVDMVVAYSCFSTDAVTKYCFGESFGLLAQKEWYPNLRQATAEILRPMFLFRFFPFLKRLSGLAELLINYLPKDTGMLIRLLKNDTPSHLSETIRELQDGIQHEPPTIFGSLIASQLDDEEKHNRRLEDEANSLLMAGAETTSWTLSVTTHHLLARPEILSRVTEELRNLVIAEGHENDQHYIPGWAALEGLPYFNAVVQEGLRLSSDGSSRNCRVPTQEDLLYRGQWQKKPIEFVIPRGYAIGMSALLAHHDENIYPDSRSFTPDRWLNMENRKILDKGFLGFSKGARNCTGMNLALGEIYICLATLILHIFPRAQLYEVPEEGIGSVRVMIK